MVARQRLLAILFTLAVGCNIEEKLDSDGSAQQVACAEDSQSICRELSKGIFQIEEIGRVLPECDFPSYTDEVDISHCEMCKESEREILETIAEVRSCTEDAQCIYTNDFSPTCAVGCAICYNKVHDISSLLQKIESESCRACDVQCSEPGSAICAEGICQQQSRD